MSREYVAQLIKAWRKKHNKTRPQVKKQYGISSSVLFRLETAQGVFSPATMRKVNVMTGISMDILSEMTEEEDVVLENYAREYNRTHPFVFDFIAKAKQKIITALDNEY